MNHFGRIAERYWTDYLPRRVEEIDDPITFFSQLGEQVQSEVDSLYAAMTKIAPQEVSATQTDGWRNTARKMAEEQVLAELVYLDPEPTSAEDWAVEVPGWRDLWPDTIITDVIQESYDVETGPPS